MAAAILAFSGKYASCLVCLRLPAFRVLNLNLNLSLNLPQFAEWQHIQVKPRVMIRISERGHLAHVFLQV